LSNPFSFARDGVRLAGLDFGGDGPPVVLLHGLGGYVGEWTETASWMSERWRVLALDARGHGDSERRPRDVSPAARVDDVVFVLEQLQLDPVALLGQSMGGQTALLVAAERPDLVRGLVVAEAGPAAGDAETAAVVEEALARWPEPRFELDVAMRMLREADARDYWSEWERITCPALVVRAGKGMISAAEATEMAERLAQARLAEVPGAGHDLHLERPAEWRAVVSRFLE
jgi:pimeloyl-ACP methyl ester carboxylesterase